MNRALAPELAKLAVSRPELGISLDTAVRLVSLDEICASSQLDGWLADTATLALGIDPKTAAAYLISIFVWRLGDILGALYLDGALLPQIDAADLSTRMDVAGQGRSRDVTFRFALTTAGVGLSMERETFARSIVGIHTPLVNGLHERTGLSRRALWRLVTDGISAGLLEHGKRNRCVPTALQEANAILSSKASPLHNPQWGFVEVAPPGAVPEWFRLRGGCCRLYKTAGREYCTTCVLRPAASQVGRLETLVAGRFRS